MRRHPAVDSREDADACNASLESLTLQLCIHHDFTLSDSGSVVRTAGSNRGLCNWHAPEHNTYASSRSIGLAQTTARCGQTTCDWWPITWPFGFTPGFLNTKRPSLPRITRSLSSGPPRLEGLTGGTEDHAIGWKRPSKAHPNPSGTPSKVLLDGLGCAGEAHPSTSKE